MTQDGKIPMVGIIKVKPDPIMTAAVGDPEIAEEHAAEAAGGDESYDIDAGLRATHADNLADDEMETKPVDWVANEVVDDDNKELVKEANR